MPNTPNVDRTDATPSRDLATTLEQLPRNGAEDAVTRVLEVYEAAERLYRAGARAGQPVVGASTSTNG